MIAVSSIIVTIYLPEIEINHSPSNHRLFSSISPIHLWAFFSNLLSLDESSYLNHRNDTFFNFQNDFFFFKLFMIEFVCSNPSPPLIFPSKSGILSSFSLSVLFSETKFDRRYLKFHECKPFLFLLFYPTNELRL